MSRLKLFESYRVGGSIFFPFHTQFKNSNLTEFILFSQRDETFYEELNTNHFQKAFHESKIERKIVHFYFIKEKYGVNGE